MTVTYLTGDCVESMRGLADGSVQTCVTSPPYWGLRDYGMGAQLGLEKTPEEYVANMVQVFREVKRVLRDDGTLWLNVGDSYAGGGRGGNPADSRHRKQATNVGSLVAATPVPLGLKAKDLVGIPWRVAFALQADGWYLRQDIIWHKPNPMPESVTDRCTKSHEYIFMLTKQARYYYDADAIKEPASEFDWESRKGRAKLNHKSMPTDMVNGIRPDVKYSPNGKEKPYFKDARLFDGKNAYKQRGHSRPHDGFNDRWDKMKRTDQCNGMRNKRDVWTVPPANYPDAHFATFPPDLIEPCILAGSKPGDTVLDPFGGSGTTGIMAQRYGRNAILCELNPDYIELARKRIADDTEKQLKAML